MSIVESRTKVLLGLAPGIREDTASCRDFLRNLKARNLNDPVLISTDGAPGLIRAVEEVFPKSLRQRCLALQDHSACIRRKGRIDADVCGADPSERDVALCCNLGIRIEATRAIAWAPGAASRRTRGADCEERIPLTNFQRSADSTGGVRCMVGRDATNSTAYERAIKRVAGPGLGELT